MNRDDRAGLVEMGRQFCPELFVDIVAPGELNDESVLELVGKAFAVLHAVAQEAEMARAAAEASRMVKVELPPVATDAQGDPQPTFAEVEAWAGRQTLSVRRQRVELVQQPGGRRRRVYSASHEAASMDDVLSWRLDVGTGLLHLVLCDGQTARLPWP